MSKKKRTRNLIIMGAALVVVVGGYLAVTNLVQKETATDTPADTSETVAQFDAATMTALSYTSPESDGTLAFTCSDGAWTYDADPTYPVNGDLLDAMAKAVSKIVADRRIDMTGKSIADFGLDAPSYTISCSYLDATGLVTKCTYYVGDDNAFNSAYYFSVEGDDAGTVYMVSSDLASSFNYAIDGLLKKETVPAINADTVASVTLTMQDGATATVTDKTGIEGLLSLYDTLKLDKIHSYKPDEALLAQAGLDTPDTVAFTYTQEVQVQDTAVESSVSTVQKSITVKVLLGGTVTASDGTELTAFMFEDLDYVYLCQTETANALRAYLDYVPEAETDTAES